MTERKISDSDRATILASKNKVLSAFVKAEQATGEARIAQLEHNNLAQQLFIKYKLDLRDTINETSGVITTYEERLAAEEVAKKEAAENVENETSESNEE